MVELCMHNLPYEGERPDGNTISSGWLQLLSHNCV